MDARQYNESDPRHHAVKIQHMLKTVLTHCREDASKIEEPKAQALCEATAEVLNGLKTTWEHYETGAERALRQGEGDHTYVPEGAKNVTFHLFSGRGGMRH